MTERRDVVVVGAGLAGLAAALHLSRAGFDVALLEAADAVGGRARTDVVDGFRLDRGFQVHNTAYPEPARLLDAAALDLRAFTPGALVARGGRLHRVADPRRRPLSVPATLTAPIGGLADKLRVAALTARCVLPPARRLLDRPETTTQEALERAGLSADTVEQFFRPFLSGVFLETELATSSRFFELVLRCFALGTQCVPADGIGAIPAQLATQLSPGILSLGRRVERVRPGEVRLGDGTVVAAGAVVVATDPVTATELLPELGPAPRMNGLTTLYHSAAEPPLPEAVLVLDGERRGLVANSIVLTATAPEYAPPGRHLVSSSVVAADADEPSVRAQLRHWYGPQVDGWDHVATYRVPAGTPDQSPPMGHFRRPVRVRPGLYVAGDWRDSASTQGALVSGRRAAAAVRAELVGSGDGARAVRARVVRARPAEPVGPPSTAVAPHAEEVR